MVTQLDDENDLIKLPQNNDTSVYYEYVASRFINYRGFEAHHPEIVEKQTGRSIQIKDFVNEKGTFVKFRALLEAN